MKVIVVNDFAHVNGGAASVAIASAVGLASRGHGVTFFSAVQPVDPALTEANVEIACTGQHEILKDPNRIRATCQGLWNPVAGRELLHELDKVRPDETIVHVHGWSKALSSSVVRAAIDRDFKVVCTMHDYFTACPNGGFFDYQSLDHCHLKPLSPACISRNCDSRSYPQKLWRVARQAVQAAAGRMPKGVAAFIAVSRFSRGILVPHLPKRVQIFQIGNPIDVPRRTPVEVDRNGEFVMVARLSPEKGGKLFAEAARQCQAQATFVGDGSMRQEIAAEYPAAKITGWVGKSRATEYVRRARALVFPSLCYEAQPLAILEAAAQGIPAVVSDGCAGAESIVHGVTGLLFKQGDARSLGHALRVLQEDNLARRLGRAAYDRYWADPPTIDRHVSQLENVYETVLSGRHSTDAGDSERQCRNDINCYK